MKKITILLMSIAFFNVFSQDENQGNRTANIFYPTIDKTEKYYNISIDLFEFGDAKYIEAELYNEDDEKLKSKIFEIISREDKYYLHEKDGKEDNEKEVFIYDIDFQLENPDNNLAYPKLKIKLMNLAYQVMDYSQKVFY